MASTQNHRSKAWLIDVNSQSKGSPIKTIWVGLKMGYTKFDGSSAFSL
jgi:hypothetical protein